MSDPEAGAVYFEFTAIGSAVRVAAIDAATGVEVVIMGPAGAARSDLQQAALGKLKARMAAAEENPKYR